MKFYLLILTISFSTIQIFAQSSTKWTPKHVEVLQNFGADTSDIRGVQLSINENSTLQIQNVFNEFFSGSIKKDFYLFELKSTEIPTPFLNKPLGIYELIELYIFTKKL